jgi:hypothetical protein
MYATVWARDCGVENKKYTQNFAGETCWTATIWQAWNETKGRSWNECRTINKDVNVSELALYKLQR